MVGGGAGRLIMVRVTQTAGRRGDIPARRWRIINMGYLVGLVGIRIAIRLSTAREIKKGRIRAHVLVFLSVVDDIR